MFGGYFTANGTPSTGGYRIKLQQNGSDLPAPENTEITFSTESSQINVPFDFSVIAKPDDTFELQIEAVSNTNDVTIGSLHMAFQEG